jgi:hypothetical protein
VKKKEKDKGEGDGLMQKGREGILKKVKRFLTRGKKKKKKKKKK